MQTLLLISDILPAMCEEDVYMKMKEEIKKGRTASLLEKPNLT